jgi:sugar O-acyltransferase (sialic acid O-acetyltransferase NeuD family)
MTLGIIGTGGHAKSLYDIVKKKTKIYFFDKSKKVFYVGNKKFTVISDIEIIKNNQKKISKAIVAIGDNNLRRKYFIMLKKKQIKLAKLVHPQAYCGFGVKIGEGTVLMHGTLINTDTEIGDNCIINSNSSIDHDCIIKNHSHICPGVTIAGNVVIGKNCWIGLGAKIIQNCVIGDNVFVAAGAVVTKNIKSNSFVKGIPAKYAKKKLA